MQDDDLKKAIADWEIDLPDDPHFHQSVWREISIREDASVSDRVSEIFECLVSPRFAVPLAVCSAAVVIAAASLHGMQNRTQAWNRMALAYKSTIDPIAHTEHLLEKGQ